MDKCEKLDALNSTRTQESNTQSLVQARFKGLVQSEGSDQAGRQALFRIRVKLEDEHPAPVVRHWVLRKNCSFTPRQVLWFYLSLTSVALGIAGYFAWRGLWLVLPFALLENLGLALALLYYARHALDRDCIWLHDGKLRIDLVRARGVTQYRFPATWTRLEWRGRRNDILCLCHGSEAVRVGSYVTPRQRRRFAAELRTALKLHGQAAA